MSLNFAAIVPHPPLILPSIGKENTKLLKKTAAAYRILEDDLYASQPDTLVIISPHGCVYENSFCLNQSPVFTANLESFGDFATKADLIGNVALTHRIRERLETRAPLQMLSEPKLDYGSSIPLMLLTAHLPKLKIIPVYYSGQGLEANWKFGQLLKREILLSNERVAVVASGDLSHRLSKASPAGYSAKGKKFDKEVLTGLLARDTRKLLDLDSGLIHEACECGLKSMVMLLGVLEGIKYEPRELSYEAPFGIGYLVMEFRI